MVPRAGHRTQSSAFATSFSFIAQFGLILSKKSLSPRQKAAWMLTDPHSSGFIIHIYICHVLDV